MTNFRTLATEMLARLFARSDEYKKRLKSSPGQLDLFGGPRADIQKSVKFDPDKHPRAPKGDTAHHGGQFVPKDEAKADVSKPPEDEPAKVPPEPEKKPEPAASEEPEIPEEFYDTEFDTGEPVGESSKPDLTEAVTSALVDAGLAKRKEYSPTVNAATKGDAAKQGARRSRTSVHFDTPIVGPSGGSLSSYDWKWMYEEGPEHDDPIRVSDWDEAELNEHTGRNVVHQFHVRDSKGQSHVTSLETALKLLGFDDGSVGMAKVKTLATASMQLAMQRQQHQQLLDEPHRPYKEHDIRRSKQRTSDLESRVKALTKEASLAASGTNPIAKYKDTAKELHRIRDLFHTSPTNRIGPTRSGDEIGDIVASHRKAGTIDRSDENKVYEEGKRIYRAVLKAARMNILGEKTPKTPDIQGRPASKIWPAVKPWSDAKIRNWYHDRGEDAEQAISEAKEWLKRYHPHYKESSPMQTEPSQYAKRPLKSSPGQIDLFGGKSTSGQQKDLLSQKPKGDKKWTAEDEKKHPRGEGGKFTFLNAGTGERSGAVHDALDSHQNMDADMVGMMFNVVHPSQHGDLRKAIDAARPDLSDVTEKHEREHGAMGQKAKMETTELATSPAQWPHEMTIAEYKSRRGDNKESLRFHKSEVKRAISEGKSVPPDVLADYPDLKPTPQPNMVTTEDAAPAQPAANSLPGGKGDKTPEAALPTKEVAKGAKVETEHTSDQAKAKEIAKDHLTEDTGYYDKLADMEKKPKTPPAIPGQQRGLFNETATGQKKLFDFVPPSKAKSAAKPEEKTLADEVQPVKQVESLPGQKSLLDSATAALSKAGLHQGETTPVANVSTSGYSEGQTGTTSAPASSDAKGETMATATTWTPKPNTTKNRLITTGETKAVRDSLKAAGWKWMPLQLSWYLDVDDATADAIRNEETRVDALRKVKGTKKGTITKLEGHVVHQSPTYAPKTQPNTSVSDEYDVDAAGNFAAGARIPGSLDRI